MISLSIHGVSARKVVMMSEVVNPCNKDHIMGHMPTSKPIQAKRWITSDGDKFCFVFTYSLLKNINSTTGAGAIVEGLPNPQTLK